MYNTTLLRERYHKIIDKEYKKYKVKRTLHEVFLTQQDIKELNIAPEVFQDLLEKGFIISIDRDRFRSLHMDVAARASDIRIKYGGTKYVLESQLDIRLRPMLRYDYVHFDRNSKELVEFINVLVTFLKDKEHTINFLRGLSEAGIRGLSRYQFHSILSILQQNKDVIMCAPTAFGKTYAFIIPALVECVRAARDGKRGTIVVIFYPRKSLGSDQMGKLIKLVYYINRSCNINITIGIDDGEVGKKEYLQDGRQFRGIKCPIHEDTTLIVKNKKVFCPKGHCLNYIRLSRRDFTVSPPTILITNVWTYQYRLVKPQYWKNGYLNKDIKFFIFDEVHAYRSLVAGIIRYFIKILKDLVAKNSRMIFSSATIPKLEDFVYEITGTHVKDMVNLIYSDKVYGKDFEKLELYLLIGINPYTSWETYVHELAIFLSTVNRLIKANNLQSLIFVDSIKNINRLFSQTHEAVKLGDPKDHLSSSIKPDDPFCYWVYNKDLQIPPSQIQTSRKVEQLRNEIIENIEFHYSQRPDRFEVEDRIKDGNVDLTYTTSTLELGVDYDKVSVIVNTGIPFTLESIIQRVGRAGRDEKRTLNTSLSIIVVRNNPLEYFYLYRGIEGLLSMEKLPKVPVSYSNEFVVLYSVMLYIVASLARDGKEIKGSINTIDELLEYFEKNKDRIYEKLGISIDITRLKDEIQELLSLMKKENMEEKCKHVYDYINRLWFYEGIKELTSNIKELLDLLNEKMDKVPSRDKGRFLGKLEEIKEILKSIKSTNNFEDLKQILYDLEPLFNRTIELIRGSIHPLYPMRSDLIAIRNRVEKYISDAEKITDITVELNEDEYGKYLRACEIYRAITENIIQLIENLIGFKFMGMEFMDQPVEVKSEFQLGEGPKEFITNIMNRMPPFELVNIPFEEKDQREITSKVGARHFWLPRPKRIAFLKGERSLPSHMRNESIIKGKLLKIKDITIPERIELLDLLSYPEPLIIKIRTKAGPLYIKYGSERTNIKIRGRYSLSENIRNLYTIAKDTGKFRLVKDATLEALKELDNNVRNKNTWGLNFRYVSLCLQGKCVSTDPYDDQCPKEVQQECRLCDGKKWWNSNRKIFPKFYLRLMVKNLPETTTPLIADIETKTYEELKNDIQFIYDSAYVYLPIRFSDYALKEIEIEPIGYTARTSFILIKFNELLIRTICDLLLKDKKLLELLKFKYYMYQQYKRLASSLDASLECLRYDSKKINIDNEFREFVVRSLIHSLAHLFYVYLSVEKIGLDPQRIVYFIKGNSIYILENSKNDGIGMVETLKGELLNKGSRHLLEEFYAWAIDFLSKHNNHIKSSEMQLKKESRSYIELLKDDKELTVIQEKLTTLNKEILSKVPLDFIDLITYRHIVSKRINISDEKSEYLLTLINAQEAPHLCFDGCNECLVFYRGCSEPFAQIYLLSKLLTTKFLDLIRRKSVPLVNKGVGRIIENLMEDSEKVVIKSPFIDDFGVTLLERFARDNKDITIVTRESGLRYLKRLEPLGVKVRTAENFHTKLYYFKKGEEEVLIQGSANLTRKGFYENEENITILWDKAQFPKQAIEMK